MDKGQGTKHANGEGKWLAHEGGAGILTGNDGNDLACTVALQRFCSLGQGSAGVRHVVDQNGDLVFNLADQDHGANNVRPRSLLVDQREGTAQAVCDSGRPRGGESSWSAPRSEKARSTVLRVLLPLSPARVGAHNDGLLTAQVLLDPAEHGRFCVEIVDGDIEEALNLGGMEVNRDYMTTPEDLSVQWQGGHRSRQ